MQTILHLSLLFFRLVLATGFISFNVYLLRWEQSTVKKINDSNHRKWAKMIVILARVLLVDVIFTIIIKYFIDAAGSEWEILTMMVGMMIHLVSRLAVNCLLALQAHHFGLLRGNLQREEWRSIIGTGTNAFILLFRLVNF